MPEIPNHGLVENEATREELWAHGLTIEDADDVWEGPAKYFAQPARQRADVPDQSSIQPERMKMIGPNRGGRLLTFILDVPDAYGFSHVVTGWNADAEEQARYQQPGGRMRRR